MRRLLKTRAGFTLAEVMIALVLTAVIGASVTGAFISQSRFFDQQEKVSFGRGVSRGAVNILMSELRMIERTGAFVAESAQSNYKLTLRIPYAMGVTCGTTAGITTYRRLPADTFVIREAVTGYNNKPQHSGIAWRSPGGVSAGAYTYTDGASPTNVAIATACTTNSIAAVSGAGAGNFTVTLSGIPPRGSVVMLYRKVQYEFKASTSAPGRIALYRKVILNSGYGTADTEELVAPFDTTAKFRFYVNDAATAQDAVPGTLSTITGLEITLDGTSERPESDGTYRSVPLKTSVFFKNRL